MAVHIIAIELGIKLVLEKVNLKEHKTESGEDFYQINPKGYVPVLVLDNGEILTEGVAILNYLVDLKPEAKLGPDNSSLEKYRFIEWFTFANSEIHKTFGALFAPNLEEARKLILIDRAIFRIKLLDQHLATNQYLMGENFTAVDAYVFVCSSWSKIFKIDLSEFKNYSRYMEEIAERPSVIQAMQEEGL
jgi:glutathione S-transferase